MFIIGLENTAQIFRLQVQSSAYWLVNFTCLLNLCRHYSQKREQHFIIHTSIALDFLIVLVHWRETLLIFVSWATILHAQEII